MKKYPSDLYLLSSQFQPIAQGWDSMVFLDREDPSVVLKLYDPLDLQSIQAYYRLQGSIAQRLGRIEDDDMELAIINPMDSDVFSISQNEDGVLVVLPKAEGVTLGMYGNDKQRASILMKVKTLLRQNGLPISGGFEVKPENIMVKSGSGEKKLRLTITDVGARVDECIRQQY